VREVRMMKIEEVVRVLESVRPGLASRDIIEQSSCFVFKDGWVISYNAAVSVRAPFDVGGSVWGAIPSQELYGLLSKVKDGEVELEGVGGGISIKGKKFKAEIKGDADIVLPVDKLKCDGVQWSSLPEGFMDGLRFCLFSVGRDMTREDMTCVHLVGNLMESCDNYRLTRYEVSGNNMKDAILIPYKAVESLCKYQPVEFGMSPDRWFHLRDSDSTIFSCRLHEGKYPDTSSILDMKLGGQIRFPSNMGDMLDRARVLAKVDITGECMVTVEIKGNYLTVSSFGPAGKYEETVKVKSDGDAKIQINPDFLKQILSHLREADLSEDHSKLKFIGDGYTHVVSLNA